MDTDYDDDTIARSKDRRIFIVESNRTTRSSDDGIWGPFSAPIEGQEAAEKHIARIREWASQNGVDPNRVRLKELNDNDIRKHLLERYRQELDAYLMSKPVDELRAIVEDQRKRLIQERLAAIQERKNQ